MQKTLTIRGRRFTGRQIAALMSADNMTNGDDYIVYLAGDKFFANYRQIQDWPFAPVCDPEVADAISLMPDNGSFRWTIWLTYSPATPGAILGSMTSDAKAAAARANGKRGGRPRKQV